MERTVRIGKQLEPVTFIVPVTKEENYPVYSANCPEFSLFQPMMNGLRVENYDLIPGDFPGGPGTSWYDYLNTDGKFLSNGLPLSSIQPKPVTS